MDNNANIEKYLLCDVFDAYYYTDDGKLAFMSKNLTNSDITGSADNVEVRNGRGNGLFAKLYHNKKVEISLKTNAFSFDTLAMLCGTSVGTGEGTYYSACATYKITGGLITLPEDPIDATKINVFHDNKAVAFTPDETDDRKLKFAPELEGKEVEVMPYEYEKEDCEVREIVIEADKFPEGGKLVLKGVEKSQKGKNYKTLTIIANKVSVSSDFSLSTSSEVKPVETEIKVSVLSDNGRLLKITESDLED